MTGEAMVEKFLCPGCVMGSSTKCGSYRKPPDHDGCEAHCLGTRIMPSIGLIALGMPKGFNRPGMYYDKYPEAKQPHYPMIILCPETEKERPTYDWLNIPVWALEQDGFLFVRGLSPRVGMMWTHVYEGGKASEICPQAFNVTDRYDEYD